jgi:predicted short-subunit dehydrogenase-like oxidoreductase (DUF2520 family)
MVQRRVKPAKTPISIIGLGAVGSALAKALAHTVRFRVALVGKGRAAEKRLAHVLRAEYVPALEQLKQDQGIIILSVGDHDLADVIRALARLKLPWPKLTVLHTSGPLGIKLLSPLARRGAGVAAWHPYQTFPQRAKNVSLDGVTFGITSGGKSLTIGRALARDLGGIPITVKEEDRALYHASAVFACGFVATDLRAAEEILRGRGIPLKKARAAVLHMAEATLKNVKKLGPRAALTGPAVRGDVQMIRQHLHALQKHPELQKIYREISHYLLKSLRGIRT